MYNSWNIIISCLSSIFFRRRRIYAHLRVASTPILHCLSSRSRDYRLLRTFHYADYNGNAHTTRGPLYLPGHAPGTMRRSQISLRFRENRKLAPEN